MLISGKGGASHKVVGKLLTQGLIEEIPARGALPIWRRDAEGSDLPCDVMRTDAGFHADSSFQEIAKIEGKVERHIRYLAPLAACVPTPSGK